MTNQIHVIAPLLARRHADMGIRRRTRVDLQPAGGKNASDESLRAHRFYRGKLQTALKCPIRIRAYRKAAVTVRDLAGRL